MMEVKNCKKCGKIFNSVAGKKICADCEKLENEEFKVVKDFLYDHPNANMQEVAEKTGVEEEVIMRFLRDGRLAISDSSSVSIYCEKCGAPIKSGRFCEKCQSKLGEQFSKLSSGDKSDDDRKREQLEKLRNLQRTGMHTDVNKK